MAFHESREGKEGRTQKRRTAAQSCLEKERRVREGHAHAALVYDHTTAVGWCQFGPTDELPRIKHRRQYLNELIKLPDWRITCFFVDREYRGKGVASIALAGALQEIARLGGGTVESYPEDVEGRTTSSFVPVQRIALALRAARVSARTAAREASLGGKSVRRSTGLIS